MLGYSAEDYLHSREQLVKLVDQGLKPPPSLFVQLEACAHKMSEEDLRDEYKWCVSPHCARCAVIERPSHSSVRALPLISSPPPASHRFVSTYLAESSSIALKG